MTARELREILFHVENQKLTVDELRGILFQMKKQDAELDEITMRNSTKNCDAVLKNPKLVDVESCVRSFKDSRKKVDRHVYEYYDTHNNAYRKSFETARGENFKAPLQGTHAELNSMKYLKI